MISMRNAGTDFFTESLTLKCIASAPNIRIEMMQAPAKAAIGYHKPIIRATADPNFKEPTK